MDLVTGFIHCVLCTPFNTTSHIAPITKPHPGAKHVGLRDFFFFLLLIYYILFLFLILNKQFFIGEKQAMLQEA